MNLDTLFSKTADGVSASLPDGRIVYWNRSAERILGYSSREVIGRPCHEVFSGLDCAGNQLCGKNCQIRAQAEDGKLVHDFDMATRTKEGSSVWLNISVILVPGASNGANVSVYLFRDVTAAHEIQNLLRERITFSEASSALTPDSLDLTRREIQILRMVATGARTRTIANQLHISTATVRNHVQHIFAKLGIHSRLEAAAYATRHGLV